MLPVFDNPIPSRAQITDLVFLEFTKLDGRIGGKMHYNMAFDTKRKKTYLCITLSGCYKSYNMICHTTFQSGWAILKFLYGNWCTHKLVGCQQIYSPNNMLKCKKNIYLNTYVRIVRTRVIPNI